MWRNIVFVLFFLIVGDCCVTKDISGPIINMVLKGDDTTSATCPSENVTQKVIAGTSYTVVMESQEEIQGGIMCYSAGKVIFQIKGFKKYDKHCYYSEQSRTVGKEWETPWSCKIDQSKDICNVMVDLRNPEFEPQVKVNGGKISTRISNETESFDSVATYSFLDGEYVTYSCHNNNTGSAVLALSSNAHGNIQMNKIRVKELFLYLKFTKENDGNFINCHRYGYNNNLLFVTRINFKHTEQKPGDKAAPIEVPTKCKKWEHNVYNNGTIKCLRGTAIEGLQKGNVLGMYYRNWQTFSILYDYHDKENLKLKCDANEPQWRYNGIEVDKLNSTNSEIADALKNSEFFQLKSNDSRINIACTDANVTDMYKKYSKNIEIIFIRRDYPKNTDSSKKPDNVPSGNKAEIPAVDDRDAAGSTEKTKDERLSIPVIATATGCALVFIVILCFITFQLLKRKPVVSPNQDSNINYENLPEHNSGGMPVPSQWQEAQYAAPADRIANSDYAVPFQPNLDEMYATPVPKNQRNENDDPQYVSVEESNPTYAQPVPKHKRTGVAVLPTNGDAPYAELSHKPGIAKKPKVTQIEKPYAEITQSESSYGNSESPYADARFSENPYAEVGISEHSYADPKDLQSKGYVNVFNDPRYVNADSKDDYAEPAYCEINKYQK